MGGGCTSLTAVLWSHFHHTFSAFFGVSASPRTGVGRVPRLHPGQAKAGAPAKGGFRNDALQAASSHQLGHPKTLSSVLFCASGSPVRGARDRLPGVQARDATNPGPRRGRDPVLHDPGARRGDPGVQRVRPGALRAPALQQRLILAGLFRHQPGHRRGARGPTPRPRARWPCAPSRRSRSRRPRPLPPPPPPEPHRYRSAPRGADASGATDRPRQRSPICAVHPADERIPRSAAGATTPDQSAATAALPSRAQAHLPDRRRGVLTLPVSTRSRRAPPAIRAAPSRAPSPPGPSPASSPPAGRW